MVKLDILADPACPWCYVGKAYLIRALEQSGDHPFDIEWHPYQINPDLPLSGVDRAEYLETLFGSREAAAKAHVPLAEHAQAAGVTFDFEAIKRTPNTRDAHRLIHWAGLEGRQTPVVHAIFRAYWSEGRDIGQHSVLIDIAEKMGMDPAMVGRLLASDADIADIRDRQAHSRKMGVNSVPTFIVDHRYAVQGAQPTEVWINVIRELAEQAQTPSN